MSKTHPDPSPKIQKLKLTFCGGVGAVTGANFLLESPETRVLVDCGLEQGTPEAHRKNYSDFIYNPLSIDILLVTHAHMDHIGRIPKLVRDGFEGVIYSTPETLELCRIMLRDALKLTTQEAKRQKIEPLYEEGDVSKAFTLWKTIPYHTNFTLSSDLDVYLKDSGHVLGSAMFEVIYKRQDGTKRKIAFTGDLGNSPSPLLRDTEDIVDADYLIMESVYGDRNHEDKDIRKQKLADIIEECIKKKSVLVMPVFSLEKTQELLYEMHTLFESKQIPEVPVYLDSPLAIELTEVYRKMSRDFNDSAKSENKKHDILDFPCLRIVRKAEDSKMIVEASAPKIVMAGSGMSNGGRIQHHEAQYLSDPNNTILFTGYQSVGTVGHVILNGAKEIELFGHKVKIKANIESISGYSSHKDSDNLVSFVEKNR
jgi:metallo-beta-lactamase family protein